MRDSFTDEELDAFEASIKWAAERGITWQPTARAFNKLASLAERRERRKAQQKK